MFKRVILEDWASLVPMISFGILFIVFLVTSLRAIRLRPSERERLARLPLEDDSSR